METGNKFNENIQIFSPEQISRIYDELKINPLPKEPLKTPKAAYKKPAPAPEQSVEDILKDNFIAEDSE